MRRWPAARRGGILVKQAGDELLVYDLEGHRPHSLNRAAAAAWRQLDGRTPVPELARRLGAALGGPADEDVGPFCVPLCAEGGLGLQKRSGARSWL
jgi:hypothetical protein